MDKRRQHPTKPTTSSLQSPKTPDTKIPSKPFYMLNQLIKPNPNHKISRNPPPNAKDYNLKAKALSLSADFDFSSRLKHHKTVDPKEVPEERVVEFASQKAQLSEKKKKKTDDGKKLKDPFEGKHYEISKSMPLSLSGGGRSRSFGGMYEVELPNFLVSNGAKVVSADMPPFMQIHAVDCARKTHDSLEKFNSKSLALTLKKSIWTSMALHRRQKFWVICDILGRWVPVLLIGSEVVYSVVQDYCTKSRLKIIDVYAEEGKVSDDVYVNGSQQANEVKADGSACIRCYRFYTFGGPSKAYQYHIIKTLSDPSS